MTQEDKQLLLKDLCSRLPYGVKVELHDEVCTVLGYFDDFVMLTSNTPLGQQTNIANIKPYLRPISSMTEEERKYFWDNGGALTFANVLDDTWEVDKLTVELLEWLNTRHFDYRGLIPIGLALEAPEDMYKQN